MNKDINPNTGLPQDESERQLYIHQKLDIIGQLAGGISHNFNNQLTGIMGFANLINMRSEDTNIKRFAEEILGICRHAGDMVRELLMFARYRPTATTGTDVHNVILTIVSLLSNSLDKRIVIKYNLNSEHHVVLADAMQLQSILLNLALNSKDAMPKGGDMLFSTEFVDASRIGTGDDTKYLDPATAQNGAIRIEVSDTGSGFGPDVTARLFEPFFTTKERGHVGLGLAAAYKFVKLMHGSININSVLGEGTSVVVMLPIHIASADAAPAEEAHSENVQSAPAKKMKKSGGTILLVDDDKGIRDSLSAFLRSTGYSVFTAEDGQDAVEKYKNTHASIDMVIMDMVMPRMGGKDAFVKMKEINPEIRAIGITGFTNHSITEMTALGMKLVLHKPFAFEELSNVVAEYI
ncbi:MAG: response regulator [Chitinispirillia bacterium]|nr:response regulator [Chitinispirillia bacterium]MCL2241440.1 response regulator [Chitinispirillia bacterium]